MLVLELMLVLIQVQVLSQVQARIRERYGVRKNLATHVEQGVDPESE